jgi:hypothetical protein
VKARWNSLRKEHAKINIVVGWFQLDNHCPNAPFPVAVCPSVERESDLNEPRKTFSSDRAFLELKLDFAPQHRTGIQCLSAGAALHDVSISLDLAFILRMQRFLLGVQEHIMEAIGNGSWSFIDSQETWDIPNIERLIKERSMSGRNFNHKAMYFQRLAILPCRGECYLLIPTLIACFR